MPDRPALTGVKSSDGAPSVCHIARPDAGCEDAIMREDSAGAGQDTDDGLPPRYRRHLAEMRRLREEKGGVLSEDDFEPLIDQIG